MPAITKELLPEAQYLEQERNAEYKSEYFRGEVFAMAGATKEHNSIVASLIGELYIYTKGKTCRVYPSDLRVHNPANSLYTYPDVTVVCGKEEYLDDTLDTLLNPQIIVEVLSPATEDYDRGTKFKLYRSIPSLQNYVLVSSTEQLVEVYTRNGDTWVLTTAKSLESHIHISSINLPLALRDIYAQVALPNQAGHLA